MGVKAEVEKTDSLLRNVGFHRGSDVELEGVRAEVEGDRREERDGEDRWIEVTVDIPGQREDDAMVVFLAQMLQEGLVADGRLRNRLVINSRWHWRLFVDVQKSHPLLSPHRIQLRGSN